MTHFIKNANVFTIAPAGSLDIHSTLPVGTYIVKFDIKIGFFLEQAEAFGKLPSKVYGSTSKTAQRILSTYHDRENSTGVLLGGEKGSGKTMLAKMLSTLGAEIGIPTLIINTAFCGDSFNKFIQDINQECIILFDEFEKVYKGDTDEDENKQEQLLTLLDGVFPQKKLFILTCNNMFKIDDHLKNRPGRIFYFLEYKGLEESFVREYLEDNLKDKTQIAPFIKAVGALFDTFNFDMMKAMVEEMNRYNETVSEVMEYINTRPSFSYNVKFDVEVKPIGSMPKVETLYTKVVCGNPLANEHEITGVAGGQRIDTELTHSLLTGVDPVTNTYFYSNGKYEFTLRRQIDPTGYDYMKAF